MSLRIFHIIFIMFSVLLAIGFGFWCFSHAHHWAGIVSLILSMGLAYYGYWFIKKSKRMKLI